MVTMAVTLLSFNVIMGTMVSLSTSAVNYSKYRIQSKVVFLNYVFTGFIK